MKTCKIEDCEKPTKGRGYCGMHYSRLMNTGTTDARVPNREKTCEVEGCEKPVRNVNMCELHYSRKRQGVDLLHEPKNKNTPCAIEGCDLIYFARGWCRKHYGRWLRNGHTELQGSKKPQECPVEGCDRDIVAKGYCYLHYVHQLHGIEPHPPRINLPTSKIKEEGGRECTCCHVFKKESEFYQRAKPRKECRFSKCKDCTVALQYVRKYKRHGGKYPQEAYDYLRSININPEEV